QSSGLRGCPLLTSPMIPFVSPAPLSACTLPGLIVATPQPSAISCSMAGGSALTGGAIGPRPAPRPGNTGAGNATSGIVRPPNIIITGTGPFASAGNTIVI